ncbi:MAG: B12-binding domain-containing radical SAM protein [Elusimicrobia bacterium]|nr:B12-binding domain-containing radical SAM protein [Candidatus Liberimonas magnetica]
MKILLITPKSKSGTTEKEFWDYEFMSLIIGEKQHSLASLALPTLAALTPPDVQVEINDENIENIDFNSTADLVGITTNTHLSLRAYEIADLFREKGKKVVLGGIHASMLPQEAIKHSDAVVIGEAENTWAGLVDDFKNNKLKKYYESSSRPELSNQPFPRWDLVHTDKYALISLQTTRGCPYDCEFCSVKAFSGLSYRRKPIESILREIELISKKGKKLIFFADDNLIGHKEFGKELVEGITPYNIAYSAQSSIDIAHDENMLKLMAKSGCKKVIIGFESLCEANLKQLNKAKAYKSDKYINDIEKIQSYGIEVKGSFIVGCDFDDESVFEKTANFIESSGIASVVINILTPYPGTRLFSRFEQENRLIHKDWSKYDNSHVCFYPKLMSPEALQNGYNWLIRKIFSYDSIFKRMNDLWMLWDKYGVRRRDRVSPLLVNLSSHDIAQSYPRGVHPALSLKKLAVGGVDE